ncbi:Hsp20/alpha crystallin family protein [Pseudodesulfovibrio sp. zrk46]|uniref:Hsp20/alpha crystallin family protein n=1 Tax=Pseudodesulfovibrio sp. zrk46 TaxID=2725288 RepID=UPI0014497A0F|nr:Hsp20/alpha crystallin family protein [Pseudodesulfovibrio sp. zrk46]QJB55697.1 Hsp20/alpha crystallin family protein [Pseudodesulfovibrio sp. zrk46]
MSELVKTEERNLTRYRPATDILEREDGFYIFMDLPGVKRENMSIDLQEGELVVTGRTSLAPSEDEHFVEMQFGDCEYVRSIAISDIVDRERIKANLDNGVLELHLPKVEKVQPKKIEIIQG